MGATNEFNVVEEVGLHGSHPDEKEILLKKSTFPTNHYVKEDTFVWVGVVVLAGLLWQPALRC